MLHTKYEISDRRLAALQAADAAGVVRVGNGIAARTLQLMARGSDSWGDLIVDTVDGKPVITGIRLNHRADAARVRGENERKPQPTRPARTSAYAGADPLAVFSRPSTTDDLPF